jgi:hypothetical protein
MRLIPKTRAISKGYWRMARSLEPRPEIVNIPACGEFEGKRELLAF